MHSLIMTFDIEDFINLNALDALHTVLEMLRDYEFRGLFFVTGLMAEKLINFPEIVELLKHHEIGFHSSGHSVRPTIPEYTDVKSYDQAYKLSIERETSHINPLTGKIEDEGGIYFVKDLFAPKKIEAFRAPGMSWTPPNLEALLNLGIKFDFSSNVSSEIFQYKNITFYPYTFTQRWDGALLDYRCLLYSLLRRRISIFDLHPTLYVNQYPWDTIYYEGNPKTLFEVSKRLPYESQSLFKGFELLLKRLRFFQHSKLIETDPKLGLSSAVLKTSKNDVERIYKWSMRWCGYFHYNPKFIRAHFYEFFEEAYS